jgi:hypothetical protein
MTIPSAPNTITVGTAPNETVFQLVDISTGKVTYRSSKVGGVTISAVKAQPVLTFSRREPSPGQVTRRYETKVTVPVFDLLGTLLGSSITTKDNVVPLTATPGTPGMGELLNVDLVPIFDEVMATEEFQEAIAQLSFVR